GAAEPLSCSRRSRRSPRGRRPGRGRLPAPRPRLSHADRAPEPALQYPPTRLTAVAARAGRPNPASSNVGRSALHTRAAGGTLRRFAPLWTHCIRNRRRRGACRPEDTKGGSRAMVKKTPFKGRILMIGYGSVGRCTMPLLIKHI